MRAANTTAPTTGSDLASKIKELDAWIVKWVGAMDDNHTLVSQSTPPPPSILNPTWVQLFPSGFSRLKMQVRVWT